jgi:hypothetical protein
MKIEEIKKFDTVNVTAEMVSGDIHIGRLHYHEEEGGLVHIHRDPTRAGVVVGGYLEDLRPADIVSIKAMGA